MGKTDKNARRESRIMAFSALFMYYSRDEKISIEDCLNFVVRDVQKNTKSEDEFANKLVNLVIDNFSKIRLVIGTIAKEMPFEKIAIINQIILMLGINEVKYIKTPFAVVINEYVEISKKFGEDRSSGFINGVLDTFRKNTEQ